MSSARYDLALLPLSVAVILFSTAVPIEIRSPAWSSMPFRPLDFAVNVLLYLPLGLALYRSSLLRVLCIGAAITIAIEVSQLWSFGRFASLFDVVANAGGAVAGALLARDLARRWKLTPTAVPVTAFIAGSAGVLAVVLAVLSAIPAAPSNLQSWDPNFKLLLGNETTRDRPWAGRISAAVLVPSALAKTELQRAASLPGASSLLDRPVELQSGKSISLPADVAARFARNAVANHAFSIVARIAPANVEQGGPARVVTYSRGTLNRNFDLGQEGRHLTFRVRTGDTGPNGNYPATQTPPLLEPGKDVTVAATFDGKVARIFVDGAVQARENLWASGCVFPAFCEGELLLERGILGACAAVVALWLAHPVRRSRAVLVAFAAGIGATALLYVLDGYSETLQITPLGPLLALTGAAAVAMSWGRRLH